MRIAAVRLLVGLVTGATLLTAPVLAQTTIDATTAEFAASADHSAESSDGIPRLTFYLLEIFPAGSTIPSFSIQLGKPAPDGAGLIRVVFAPLLPTALVGGTTYRARVSAVGPGGRSASELSNAFASSAPCAPSLSATSVSLPSATSAGAVTVSAGTTCAWTAAANATWLQITSGASVRGTGTVTFAALGNMAMSVRNGTLTIAGRTVNITQAGAAPSCTYAIAPASRTVAAAGQTSTVSVTTATGCAWTARSGASWITVTGGLNRSGNGTVTIAVAANSGAAQRTGTVTLARQMFSVTQAGTCAFTVTPAAVSAPSEGATSGSFTIGTASGCTWTAAGVPSWITIATGTRTGSGTLRYAIAANPNVARSATLTIAGKLIPVNQTAAPLLPPANFHIVRVASDGLTK